MEKQTEQEVSNGVTNAMAYIPGKEFIDESVEMLQEFIEKSIQVMREKGEGTMRVYIKTIYNEELYNCNSNE